jgi:hypothetical protein
MGDEQVAELIHLIVAIVVFWIGLKLIRRATRGLQPEAVDEERWRRKVQELQLRHREVVSQLKTELLVLQKKHLEEAEALRFGAELAHEVLADTLERELREKAALITSLRLHGCTDEEINLALKQVAGERE